MQPSRRIPTSSFSLRSWSNRHLQPSQSQLPCHRWSDGIDNNLTQRILTALSHLVAVAVAKTDRYFRIRRPSRRRRPSWVKPSAGLNLAPNGNEAQLAVTSSCAAAIAFATCR